MQFDEYINYVKTSDVYRRMEEELKTKRFSSKFVYSLDDREYLKEASKICKYPVYRCKHRWTVDNISKLKGTSIGYKCKMISQRPRHLKDTAIILSYINNVEPWNLRLFEIMVQEIWYQYKNKPAYEMTDKECLEAGLNDGAKHFKYVTREDILTWAIQYSFEVFKVSVVTRNDTLRQHSSTKYKLSFEAEDLYDKTEADLMMIKMDELEKKTKYLILDYLYKKYPHYKWIKKQYEKILKMQLVKTDWDRWKQNRKIKSVS